MSESEDPIYRIICLQDTNYCLASRGGHVVFALTNQLDRYQHWMKDERHGATKKDSEGQPAFALVNKATGQAIRHCDLSIPVPLVPYNVNYCDESVLWTMSKTLFKGFWSIRRADLISVIIVARCSKLFDGHIIDLCCPTSIDDENPALYWKFEKVSPSTCISLFRWSQHTVRIICQCKVGYNLTIDREGSTVLLVPSNPKDKYQHWIKEMANGVTVKDTDGQEAFALVNKATGKAIKHGFGSNYLVQLAPFNPNYMDPSLLWTESFSGGDSFREIRMQNNIDLVFDSFDHEVVKSPFLGLSIAAKSPGQRWKIEDFE